MRLLCLLAASADAVVTRDDIINALWPRVVVNENSLTRAVSDLRRALTPAGEKRTDLVQTIPKRGYRLTQTPAAIRAPDRSPAQQSSLPMTNAKRWLKRWTPSIAASFILALALITQGGDEGEGIPMLAQLPITPDAETEHLQPLVDGIVGNAGQSVRLSADATTFPTGLPQSGDTDFLITQLGYATDRTLPAWRAAPGADQDQRNAGMVGQSMLTPDGQLLAYVDYRDGIASLRLRPAMTEAAPWTAFTTDERILNLQWSPLDAGILMTVGQSAEGHERASYLRLMLLDLETLTVHELYRRDLPAESRSSDIGNLT